MRGKDLRFRVQGFRLGVQALGSGVGRILHHLAPPPLLSFFKGMRHARWCEDILSILDDFFH